MNSAVCPKCGEPLVDGRCAKCSSPPPPSEISRSFVKPVSYVAPVGQAQGKTTQRTWKSPTLEDAITIRKVREADKRKTRIGTLLIVLVLAFIGYEIYGFFIRQASSYGGYYWNERQCFAMTFPVRGWSHYRKSQLSSLPVKDPQDAFYLGNDPGNPDILMAVWTTFFQDGYTDAYVDRNEFPLKKQAGDDIASRMAKNGYVCEMGESKQKIVAGSHGFLLYGSAQRGPHSFKSITYLGYNQHFYYTIYFLGGVERIDQHEEELDHLMDSFMFKSSLF